MIGALLIAISSYNVHTIATFDTLKECKAHQNQLAAAYVAKGQEISRISDSIAIYPKNFKSSIVDTYCVSTEKG